LEQLQNQTVELGWDFYGPVILFVVLVALAVPVWAAIGAAAIHHAVWSGALPPRWWAKASSHGIDHFALTAVPLFILTGDVLVRTGLSRKFLDVAEALTLLRQGRVRLGHRAGLRHVRGDLGLGCGGRGGCGPDDDRPAGGKRLPAPLCLCAGRGGRLYRHPDPAVDRLYHHRSGAGHIGLDPVPGRVIPGVRSCLDPGHQHHHEPHLRLGGRRQQIDGRMARAWQALRSGWYAFIVPGIIFYGIFSGRLTPTEAGAVAVVVTIIMGFILGTLKLSDFPAMLVSSAKVNGVILPIIAFSLPLARRWRSWACRRASSPR
jgi:C4-dicarboxylate transporter DctM subunit